MSGKVRPIEARPVKQAALELGKHVEFLLSATAWHYAPAEPAGGVSPRADAWTCMFALMERVQSGQPAFFTKKAPGCVGAANYLGFNGVPAVAAALYLAGRERLKRDAGLATAFYNEVQAPRAREKCLVMTRLDLLPDDTEVEVVNLWVDAASLSVLHTLANYDRAANDNVIMPFSSGCQSIWTLPFKEAGRDLPRAVVGSLDPTVRSFLPAGAMSFSAPVARFVEMCANIDGSFIAP